MADSSTVTRAISDPLREAAREAEGKDKVDVGTVLRPIVSHCLYLVVIILALLNIVLSPLPGASVVLGVPLVLATLHIALGRGKPGIPHWVERWRYDGRKTADGLCKGARWAEKAESLVRPRLEWFTRGPMVTLAAWSALAMALILLAPLPFVNVTPAAAIILLALGAMGRDGLLLAAGLVASALHIAAAPLVWGTVAG